VTGKRAYLLVTAKQYELENVVTHYDEDQQINMITRDGMRSPLVSKENSIGTESKTFAAPGDDDPDPEDEGCY